MSYKIYVFLDNLNRPYYVGRTSNFNRRRAEHLKEIACGNKLPKYEKVRKLIRLGYRFKMKVIRSVNTLKESMSLEKFYIKKYRNIGYTLYNLTSGGDDKIKIKINYPSKQKRIYKRTSRRY